MRRFGNLRINAILLSLVVLLSGPALLAETGIKPGTYAATGTNPNGTRYKGTCVITKKGPRTYHFQWTVGNSYSGSGKLAGNQISVDWGDKFPVVYKVIFGSRLEGVWANGKATETLEWISSDAPDIDGPIEDT